MSTIQYTNNFTNLLILQNQKYNIILYNPKKYIFLNYFNINKNTNFNQPF